MRSFDPNDKYDVELAARQNIEPWQLELLAMNPSYVCWGPEEDNMSGGKGWAAPCVVNTFTDAFSLDELNECVNFYFDVVRPSEQCAVCNGTGYHPRGLHVHNTFYEHQCLEIGVPRSEAWHDKITQDEADALIAEERAKPGETADDINSRERSKFGLGHDCINRHILIRARLKRLGLPHECEVCEGHGFVYTAPDAHVELVLWMLHPRKGASRGVRVKRIEQSDLPAVFAYLREAAARNAERFSKLAGPA